ncbi:MAG: NUDIX hydrolase [Burkholderiales bacterium]|nr:NUDIX hydrolase [Burkholderiales bacterium]
MKPANPSSIDLVLRETTQQSEPVFDGSLLHVRRDTVLLPNQRTTTREYIVHPGASVIVPLLEDGKLLLEQQYRYPIQRIIIEFPAGKIDAGESPLAAAQRELTEETGWVAQSWDFLGSISPVPAYSDEWIHCFAAEHMTRQHTRLDEDEAIVCIALTPEEVAAKIASGEIVDAKTICAFHFWQARR